MFICDDYESKSGNRYYRGIRFCDRVVIVEKVGLYHNWTYIDGIELYAFDGEKPKLIQKRDYDKVFREEEFIRAESEAMVRDYISGMLKANGNSVPAKEIENQAKELIDGCYTELPRQRFQHSSYSNHPSNRTETRLDMENIGIDTQNQQQVLVYELIANTNSSFFLTGRAGTGKTTFLRNVQKMVDKQFITLAPTGVAAILAGGDTIHSFFGLPLEVCTPNTCGKINEARFRTICHADTIIIDEVSMVRCDIVDAIDNTMRCVMRTTKPFGGKQVIFVGDMFQLPPVVRQARPPPRHL